MSIIKFSFTNIFYYYFKAIETAAESLKTSTDPYYRKKCWEVIKSFLAASVLSNDDKSVLMKFFSHPR